MAVARITLTGILYGSTFQNVIHFKKPDFITSELPTLVTTFRDSWLDQWKNLTIAEATFVSIRGEILASGGSTDVFTLPISIVGGSGNDVRSPLMMALVVQLKTGLAGRRNRGRIFTCGTSVGQMVNGLWTGSWLATANTYIATLKTRWITHTSGSIPWDLVIWHKGSNPDDTITVSDMAIRPTPGCQRRRELGVGI